ncbi:serine/threonine protein kinase [Aetokthonos hydrillicola Thurmond2011]|jgi:serine/threonine-protein kinase|uniref:Serine/threonine protein kinase n=1 Tax=Aetokthonos hydrillicola Thurmond2011 TaxID=2712845 RepID=A0AAP5IB89_9CYAN|nr:serine/threonine-protein kinase [Aetokthonos hydrillicola]MBO3459148.1 serine/threonine protein kinase [Aetokthonos hydrillicola CCALA 1050]MBW4584107.1 serine/threonine protein kinase [Aetokthonos hydrillicola CCALA 1050]MDR9898360.1 serine/threonine protein kinase [Aetokthonos hydrillicola Thurmond2011]
MASLTSTKLLANRYQLKQLIGRGGMGEVFLADDILLGKVPVAIKFLSQTVSQPLIQRDFATEAHICAALSQKSLHIVRVTDYGVNDDAKPFYVMEYLSGKSLKDVIPIPLHMFLPLCRQICLGLQSAHEGIKINGKIYPLVHKDIKPANILVIPDPILGQLAKILDFGIAKFLDYSRKTDTNSQFYGTLPYCSPEQLEGDELDSRSDIYSLGVMMFEMLTGQKPWQPETDLFGAWYKMHHYEQPKSITQVNPHLKIPKALDNLIMACLAKQPSDRPQSLSEVIKVLDSLETEKKASLSAAQPIGLSLPAKPASQELTWPKDKPIQEIVFPQLLNTEQGSLPALLLMMSKQQANSYARCTCYSHFIFVCSPHPMLLWATLLYERQLSPKWLPCYLDMQHPRNWKLVNSLAENQPYRLIFFTLEAPHGCTNVISSRIEPHQRQMLKSSVEKSKTQPPSSGFEVSKNLLKQQYQQLQSQVLSRLAK